MEQRRAGFTLIELIVVMTIMSILASISVVNYRKAVIHAEAARLSMNLHQMEEVVEMAYIAGDLVNDSGVQVDDFDAIVNILRRKSPDDAAAVDFPRPEGLDIDFLRATGPSNLRPDHMRTGAGLTSTQSRQHRSIIISLTDMTPDNRHAELLHTLATMRPMTMTDGGGDIVMELLDLEGDGLQPVP